MEWVLAGMFWIVVLVVVLVVLYVLMNGWSMK